MYFTAKSPYKVNEMINKKLSFWCMIMLLIIGLGPSLSMAEENSTVVPENSTYHWQVVNVTEYQGDNMIAGDPAAYGPFSYSNITDQSFKLTIGNFPDEQVMNGTITRNNEFTAITATGGRFTGTVESGEDTNLTFYPTNKSHYYSFELRITNESNLSSSNTATFNAASLDKSLFMAGVSSGLSGAEKQQNEADNAWISGNEVFTEESPVSCEGDECSCEGKTCICTGSACKGEGADLQKSGDGYSCTGFDCYLSCKINGDCELTTQ